MVEYIREYIRKNFSPNDLEDITWYVYSEMKGVDDISSHKYDYQIDKLASNYLFEYYKKKFNEKDDGDHEKDSANKWGIPLWEDDEFDDDKTMDDDILKIFGNYETSNIDGEKIIDNIAANLANKSRFMFTLHKDLTKVAYLIYIDMLFNQRDMLNKINSRIQDGNYSFEEIFETDFDNYLVEYIINLASKGNDVLEFRNTYWSVRNYIFSKMENRYENIPNRNKFIEKEAWFLAYSLLNEGVSYRDVLDKKVDDEIDIMITQDEIEKNSVGDGLIQINKKKNLIRLAAILAVAIFVFSNTKLGRRFFDKEWLFKAPDNRLTIEDIDSYAYPKIDDMGDSDLQRTIQNIVDNFAGYRSVDVYRNDCFEQLCFYKAIDSIQDHNLDVMENIFSTVKGNFSSKSKSDFTMKANYEAISQYDSYLWYVYDMMEMSGIDASEYVAAINQYLGIFRSNMISDVKISSYDSLPDESKKAIQKMLKEYGKLCSEKEYEMERQQNGERGLNIK